MQNKFNPRGIVKWSAFSAVYDPFEFSSQVNQGLFVKEGVELSDDQIFQINEDLIQASDSQCDVQVTYFENGQFLSVVGKVDNICTTSQTFKVGMTLIKMSQLVAITLND